MKLIKTLVLISLMVLLILIIICQLKTIAPMKTSAVHIPNTTGSQVILTKPPITTDSIHKCPFQLCPYKGTRYSQRLPAVRAYMDDIQMDQAIDQKDYEDAVDIDMLHFDYPDENYDELDERFYELYLTFKI